MRFCIGLFRSELDLLITDRQAIPDRSIQHQFGYNIILLLVSASLTEIEMWKCDSACQKCLPTETQEAYCIRGSGWKISCKWEGTSPNNGDENINATRPDAPFIEYKFIPCLQQKTNQFATFYVLLWIVTGFGFWWISKRRRQLR